MRGIPTPKEEMVDKIAKERDEAPVEFRQFREDVSAIENRNS